MACAINSGLHATAKAVALSDSGLHGSAYALPLSDENEVFLCR